LSATGITRGVSVSWTLPTASDLAAVEVWENTSSSTSGRYFVGETRGTGFVRTGLDVNATRHYWVRSRDLSGNLSAFVGSVSATTTLLVADDITDGILNTAKFASSIRPVEIVSSLPSSGNAQGRTVFLTTDNKLYRWTGSAWTAAVPAVDVTGQITTTQITDGAISTPKLTAGAVTADTIATNAITSDKITANAIIAGKIAASAISSAQIAAGEIKAVNLASETLITQAAQLGTAVVTTAKIGDLQVDTLKIAGNAVTEQSQASWNGVYDSFTQASLAAISVGNASVGGRIVVTATMNGEGFIAADLPPTLIGGYRMLVYVGGSLVFDRYAALGSIAYTGLFDIGPGLVNIDVHGLRYRNTNFSGGTYGVRSVSLLGELLKR
jgi:hypothetical protein